MARLAKKVVLITGATRGIGRAIAELFAKEGASLAVNSRNQKALNCFVEDLSNERRTLPVPGDVSVEADVERVFQNTVNKYGCLDMLIHCASIPQKLVPIDSLALNLIERAGYRRYISHTDSIMASE